MEEDLVSPNDWIEIFDEKKKGYYYFNYATNETTWNPPEVYISWKSKEIDAFLKRNQSTWRRRDDEQGKTSYYYQKGTKVTQWKPPDEVKDYVTALIKLTKKRHKKRKKADNEDPTTTVVPVAEVQALSVQALSVPAAVPEKDDEQSVRIKKKTRGTAEEKTVEEKIPAEDSILESQTSKKPVEDDFDAYDNFDSYEVTAGGGSDMMEIEHTPADDTQKYEEEEEVVYDWDASPMMQQQQQQQQLAQDEREREIAELEMQQQQQVVHEREQEDERTKILLAEIEAEISLPDAVMESKAADNLAKYIHVHTAQLEEVSSEERAKYANKGINVLLGGYKGYAQMTCLVTDWLSKATNLPSNKSSQDADTEQYVMHFLSKYIMENFSSHVADTLLSQKPVWLVDLISDPIWRSLLIELFAKHKGSSLLGFCIRKISNGGHYKEISAKVPGYASEFYDGLHDILVDHLAALPTADDVECHRIFDEIKRICSNSENTYLYLQDLLITIELRLKNVQNESDIKNVSIRDYFYISRLRRLNQEVANGAIWYKQQKKDDNLDVHSLDSKEVTALKLTQLWHDKSIDDRAMNLSKISEVKSELFRILKDNNAFQVTVQRVAGMYLGLAPTDKDDSAKLLEKLKHSGAGGGGQDSITTLSIVSYLRHPQLVCILLDALIHPKRRLNLPNYRTCILLALLSTYPDMKYDTSNTELLVIKQAEQLYRLRDILGEIHKLASVSKGYDEIKEISSYMHSSPINSLCVLRWITHVLKDSLFYLRSSFLSVEQALLQLVCLSIHLYPYQRSECYQVLQIAMSIPSDEMTDIVFFTQVQKQVIECFIYLISKGYFEKPLDFLVQTSHILDTGSVRHFMILLLRAISPPFSRCFALKMTTLLSTDSVYNAVNSKYFSTDGLPLLTAFLEELETEHPDLISLCSAYFQ